MKTAIVTGARGFIGHHVCRKFVDAGYKVVGTDITDIGFHIPEVDYEIRAYDASFLNTIRALKRMPDNSEPVIIHLGAWSTVRDALHEPETIFDMNAQSTAGLLQAIENVSQAKKPSKILFASSSAVLEPRCSYYGITKFTCEEMLRVFQNTTGIPTIAMRFGNIYGIGQNPNTGTLVSSIIEKMWRSYTTKGNVPDEEIQIKIFGNGESKRYYVEVGDLADAIYGLGDEVEGSIQIITNISTGIAQTTNNVVDLCMRVAKHYGIRMPEPIHTEPNPLDKDDVKLPESQLLKDYGWFPRHLGVTILAIKEAFAWRIEANPQVWSMPHNEKGLHI